MGRKNKALFLDRDGVINVDRGYVHRRVDFHFQEGIFELCQAAQSLGYLLVVVTNQAGIARGYYTESEFLELTKWMIHTFAERKVQIARVYYCPYHPIYGLGPYKFDSPDRKPKPGMLYRARADLGVDLTSSILVGDQLADMDAAKMAGVGTRILLLRAGAPDVIAQRHQCYILGSLDAIRQRFLAPSVS